MILFLAFIMLVFCSRSQYIITDVIPGQPPSSLTGWTTSTGASYTEYTYTGYGPTIIGGPGIFGPGSWALKTYTGLPGHNRVMIGWVPVYIGPWGGIQACCSSPPLYDSFLLDVDGTNFFWNIYSGFDYANLIASVSIPHNSTTITLKFYTGVDSSPTGKAFGFTDIQITVYVICTPACATCYGNDISQCYSCNSGWYLSGTTCVTICPSNQWPSGTVCQNCDSSCNTCSGGCPTNCLSCSSGTYLNLLPQGSCSPSCPGGYYPNSGSWQCTQCYQSGSDPYTCATCNGGGSSACLTCNSGTFLYPNTGGQCINPCPNGFWGDSSTNTCQTCHNSGIGPDYTCATCSAGGSSNCNSCNSGYFLYPMTGGSCMNPCPNGFWGDSSTNTCQLCYNSGIRPDYTCATCSAGGSSNCNSCNSGTFLYPNTGGQCINPCPNGFWDDCSTNTCQPCYNSGIGPDYTCATCSAGGSSNCNSCNSGYFLYPMAGGSCMNPCPNGFWGDSSTNTCQLCYNSGIGPDYTCATCSAGGSSNCNSCNSGTFLYPNTGGQCINPCPNGYWGDSSTNTCQPCYSSGIGPDYTCATCSAGGSSNCNSCNSGYFLYPITDGSCMNPCPNGYWGDTSTHQCQPCYSSSGTGPDYTCATCSAGGSSNCTSCNSGSFRHSSQCLTSCPAGYWGDTSTNECVICCGTNTFLYPNNPNTCGQCLNQCPTGYWEDNSINVCQLCTNISVSSSCAYAFGFQTASILKAFSTVSVATSAALQSSNPVSGLFSLNLLLSLTAIESIANMQYLNINHSKIAIGAYSGLSSTLMPNWIANFNTLDKDVLVFNYGILEKIKTSSLYLDNYGDSVTETLIYAIVCLLTLIATSGKTRERLLNSRIGKAYTIALGLFLSNFFGQIQSQILFSILQILKISLLLDAYSRVSYLTAYFTTTSLIGLQTLCFLRLNAIFTTKKLEDLSVENDTMAGINVRWTEKKYQMLFDTFKDDKKHSFFFSYWMTAFSTVYILLILSLQSIPVIQCLSIVILIVIIILFSALVKPMKEKSTAIIYFFNFICTLVVAILNASIAIRDELNPQSSTNDILGWAIYSVIMGNSGANILFGIGGIILGISSLLLKWEKRCKRSRKEFKRNVGLEKTNRSRIESKDYDYSSNESKFQESAPIDYHEEISHKNKFHTEAPKQQKSNNPKIYSQTMTKGINLTTQPNLQINEKRREPKVQKSIVDLEKELENSKIRKTPKLKVAERRKTQAQLNEPKKLAMNLDKQVGDKLKVAERPKTQSQSNEPKNNPASSLDTQEKEIAKDSTGGNSPSFVLRKPSQTVSNDNLFMRYEGRRKDRKLEPGYFMK